MRQNPSQLASNDAPDAVEKTAFDGENAVQIAPGRSASSSNAVYAEELRVARRSGSRWRALSRYIGMGIFLFGVALLIYVFLQALDGFKQFNDAGHLRGQLTLVQGDDWVQSLQGLTAVLGKELFRVLYLFILGYIASAIAARGISFFAASEAVIDEAVLPEG